ncbi:MAG: DUF5680 domain-containing protein [Erysipelotrichaceae bacterium]
MFYDKLIQLRKKQGLNQEQLADKLNVSRQTISKWENGTIIPALEYLIDISRLFGTTLDSLVNEDDCKSDKETIIEEDEFVSFLIKAKQETYASKKGQVEPSRANSLEYAYSDDKYSYVDSFFGSSCFSGEEVVSQDSNPIWSMNYYGRVTSEKFSGDFLKYALNHGTYEYPYRGPKLIKQGEYSYHSSCLGTIDYFNGKEEIYYGDVLVYECVYHGGILK